VKWEVNLDNSLNNINSVLILKNENDKEIFAEVQFLWGHPHPHAKLNHFFYEISRCETYNELIKSLELNKKELHIVQEELKVEPRKPNIAQEELKSSPEDLIRASKP
jgi:hypothetical protein